MGKLISDIDYQLFYDVASEVNLLTGEEIEYYRFSPASIVDKNGDPAFDPLYNESLCNGTWGLTGKNGVSSESPLGTPIRIMGNFEFDEKNVAANERGTAMDSDTLVWFARKDFNDRALPKPVIGDVVHFKNRYWSVTKVSEEGWIDMSRDKFSLYKLTVMWTTKFDQAIRVDDPKI